MAHLTDSDLRDPMPPIPGERERAQVATRAHQLGRRRRLAEGAGALALVAAVSVSVAALTAGGASDPSNSRIDAASSGPETTDAPVTTAAPATTVAPTLPPAPAPDTAPAASAAAAETPAAPAAPTTFTVSGTVGNIPEGVTTTVTLSGPGGTWTAVVNGAGHYAMSGLPAGTYEAQYSWEGGGAAQAGKLGSVTIDGNSDFSFTLQ